MSRASNLKRKQKRKKSGPKVSGTIASTVSGEPWSEIKAATTITDLYDEIVNIGAVVGNEVLDIGADNLDPDILEAVLATVELYKEADRMLEENSLWLGSIFKANEKTVQPPSRDAKLLAKVDELVDYMETVLTLFEALLAKLRNPSAPPVKVALPGFLTENN